LEAKVQALLRRIYQFNRVDHRSVTSWGDICLHQNQRLITVGERTIRLSSTEYRLMGLLLARANRPVCKAELLRYVWGSASAEPTNIVELAIARLRRKIEDDPTRPSRLVTVRSVGYQLRLTKVTIGHERPAPREARDVPVTIPTPPRGSAAAGVPIMPRLLTRHPVT
jgi:DNA-binding response OmpR family regulator